MIKQLVIDRVESPTFEGMHFGNVGPYEMLHGTAFGELDPNDPLNTMVVNLDKAPRNDKGAVVYEVCVSILKPVDLRKGNGLLLYDLVNRGNKRATAPHINGGPSKNDPHLKTDAGTGFLMNHGFTVAWSGWQSGNLLPGEGRMFASFPVATSGGRPIVGTCREEFIDEEDSIHPERIYVAEPETDWFIGGLLYPAADMDPARATLTIRQKERDRRQTPPDLKWRYLNEKQIEIIRPEGFDRGAIYEFIYQGRDPVVTGIAFASVRDLVSFLLHDAVDGAGHASPLAVNGKPSIQKAIAVGISQSGRFLRDFLYRGFNQDEKRRRVFDGVLPVVAGSRKGNINLEFATLGHASFQHETHLTPDDQFPFSYATITDPISGRTDGILKICQETDTCPKILHLDTDTEFWQARSSLLVYDGKTAISLPENVRCFLATSMQHSAYFNTMPGLAKYPRNPLEYAPFLRALIIAMARWITDGVEPPDSRFPSIVNGTLGFPDSGSYGFPAIPGVEYTGLINGLRLIDYSTQPPKEGVTYPLLVNRIDGDGNGIAGIRHPLLEAPTGTHTGWNLRAPGHAENELASTDGACFPFARTLAERMASGDPRFSLAERYPDHQSYVKAVTLAANRLVCERLLLEEDALRITQAAADNNLGRAASGGN